nr:OmpA family protein [Calditrichia bacterium]
GRARMETQRADYEFRHAMLLAQRIKNLRETDISMEEVILAGENNLHLVADAMREDVHFDSSGIYTAEKLAERAGQLVASKNSLENLLSIEKDQNQALLVYVDNLETRLNINEQTTSAIMSDYFDLASLRARYQTVADRFTSEEATVDLRTGKLVISLHGLVFPVGQATIEDQYKPLLESLAVSIKEFPGTEVVLEGHTDAVGSDELNLKLSKERATVVKDYLVSNFDIDPERIVAAGFGETRPVASNDSQVGRAKNRRIDAVIYLVPKSESISAVQQ